MITISKRMKEAIKKQLTLEADNEYDTRHKSGCEAWVTNIKIQRKLNQITYVMHYHEIEAGYQESHSITSPFDSTMIHAIKNGFLINGDKPQSLYVPLK